ncbi:farnesyl pyrophosphate synthase-like [Achroia grisella]|uniref:farnesyl pyrophosphate synthase-like n=1 Tax=Achroia grisella TaxID=688607 RepID=UPI0027D2F250|nr:farnesyl pyrophosphate synthase-like [Achroia grisella]
MLYTYKTLATKDNITEQSFYLACVLAWSAELFQCLFNILDTIEDNRYAENVQVKTLHLLPDAKAGANDVCLIISSIYEILNIHFADKSSYNNVINLFNTAFLYKATGRHFDAIVSKATTGNYALFTTEQYDNIVYLYNTYSTLHLPIYLGMTLAAKVNEKYMQDVQDICIDIGRLFQMQVEYQDCFGDGVMDKASNAIGNGKCTWLAVTALQRCTRPQQIVFNSCYGSPEPAHMERIKELYRKLKLPQIYHEQNRAIRKRIAQRIEALSQNDKGETLPPELFTDFLKQTIHDDK